MGVTCLVHSILLDLITLTAEYKAGETGNSPAYTDTLQSSPGPRERLISKGCFRFI